MGAQKGSRMFISDEASLVAAIEKMRFAGTDIREYELKSASGGVPKETAESISAFANTYGGVIVFGISERNGFHSLDIDVKTIQAGVAQAARDLLEPPQQVEITVLPFEGKPVVIANVPEAPLKEKPCYVKKLGQMKGSYIRTGDGDHKMSIYEIDRFIENQHRVARNDIAIVQDATLEDLDSDLTHAWLARVRAMTLGRATAMSNEELLASRRIASVDKDGVMRPTLAGIMALGIYPQKFFPRLNVVFTAYPTPSKGKKDARGMRFKNSLNIDGPIPSMLSNAVLAVSHHMKHGAIVKGALREDIADYPLPAVREAVANALMHRDYSADAQGTPVMIDLFPDRLEIYNPGGLFGSLTVERLGARGATASRNQFLSRILEDVPYTDFDGTMGHVVENRGSGYPTINQELADALMPAPVALSALSEFELTFRHRRMTDVESKTYSKRNVEDAIIAHLVEKDSASASELSRASGIGVKTMRGYISRLLEEGVIEAIGAKNSPKRRYRLNE